MNSARLKPPIRKLLDDQLSESEVRELWTRMARSPRRLTPLFFAWAVGFLAGAAVLLAWYSHVQTPTALRLANRLEVPSTMTSPSGAPIALGDGSSISPEPGTRLELLENTAKSFSVALRSGRALFDVRPGGPRAWRVECGRVTIEVVGTRFVVDRTPDHVSVSVERGVVVVRGDPVPDQVVRLVAGTAVTVPTPAVHAAAPAEPSAPGAVVAVAIASAVPAASSKASALPASTANALPAASSTANASPPGTPSRMGDLSHDDGADLAGSASAAVPAASGSPIDDALALFHAADRARREGLHGDAVRSLTDLVTRYPGDAQTPLAELTLGRIFLEALGRPADAAAHIERAMHLGLPAALAEDAAARVVEAHARSGNPEQAAGARARYFHLFPNGSRAEYVNRWAPPAH